MRDMDDMHPPNIPVADASEFCSTREAADLLGVSIKTAQLWVETGVLAAWKTPGGHRRIRRSSVDDLLRERLPSQAPAAAVKATSQFLTILVVDDSTTLIELYRLTIEGWDLPIRLITANDGFNALIRIGEERPDLIITDLNMPGMDGFRMVRTLRSAPSSRDLRVIIVSGLSAAEIKDQGGLPTEVEVLAKPVPFDLLHARVEALIDNR